MISFKVSKCARDMSLRLASYNLRHIDVIVEVRGELLGVADLDAHQH
jgi:hypothetical protein